MKQAILNNGFYKEYLIINLIFCVTVTCAYLYVGNILLFNVFIYF